MFSPKWDGGFIMVNGDHFDDAVKWYTEKFGWTCLNQFEKDLGKMAFMKLPYRDGFCMITLKSFEFDHEHFKASHHDPGHVRFCFEITNLELSLQYFKENGIVTTEPALLPDGRWTFDIYAYEDARLTVIVNQQLEGQYQPGHLVVFGSPATRIGVTDLSQAIQWYTDNLAFQLEIRDGNEQFAWMKVQNAHAPGHYDSILLESGIVSVEPKNPTVRVYYFLQKPEFEQMHQWLTAKDNVYVSPIAGNFGYHFYDPDGNQINIWTYEK